MSTLSKLERIIIPHNGSPELSDSSSAHGSETTTRSLRGLWDASQKLFERGQTHISSTIARLHRTRHKFGTIGRPTFVDDMQHDYPNIHNYCEHDKWNTDHVGISTIECARIQKALNELPNTNLASVFRETKTENSFGVRAVLYTPHRLIEYLGLRSAPILFSMVKDAHSIELQELTSTSPKPLSDDRGQSFLIYMITIMRLTNYAMPEDLNSMFARIEMILTRMKNWKISHYSDDIIYDEEIFGKPVQDRCIIKQLTIYQAREIAKRLGGMSIHKSNLTSSEVLEYVGKPNDDVIWQMYSAEYLACGTKDGKGRERYFYYASGEYCWFRSIWDASNRDRTTAILRARTFDAGVKIDRYLEVGVCVTLILTTTLGVIITSSCYVHQLVSLGIDITSLWSLWFIIASLSLSLFVSVYNDGWKWYDFLRGRSYETVISDTFLKQAGICKHDLLQTLVSSSSKDHRMQFSVTASSFLPDDLRRGRLVLAISYSIKDLWDSCPNIWIDRWGRYRLTYDNSNLWLTTTAEDGGLLHFTGPDYLPHPTANHDLIQSRVV